MIALEQVPPVQILWNVTAKLLAKMGYAVHTGVISAEQYDVPQVRKRAILVANKTKNVELPKPVRQAFRKPSRLAPYLTLGNTGLVPEGAFQLGNQNGSERDADGKRMRLIRKANEPSQTITGKSFRWGREDGWKSSSVAPWVAGVMQGFPADYPWRGGVTEQHQQAGDAVPPPLAWHVLRAAMGLDVENFPGYSA